jgi:hypothetical protein
MRWKTGLSQKIKRDHVISFNVTRGRDGARPSNFFKLSFVPLVAIFTFIKTRVGSPIKMEFLADL